MAFCINTSHPEYLDLLASTELDPSVLKAKISTWMEENNVDRFPTLGELNIDPSQINQTLRVVTALPKIQRNVFTKDKLQGWINDLQKQGISSQQLELFRQEAKEGMTKDEIATAIAANYSYTVEINTAKTNEEKQVIQEGNNEEFTFAGSIYEYKDNEYLKDDEFIDFIEYETAKNDAFTNPNTQYYSNLTVPGGTNYTENEIATPAITPSIKGHAQFATDKGIGWFRSDDQSKTLRTPAKNISEVPNFFVGVNNYTISKQDNGWLIENPDQADEIETDENEILEMYNYGSQNYDFVKNPTTRRILEMQSDLFQKGRKRFDLTSYDLKVGDTFETDKGLIEVTDILEGSQTINIKNLTIGTSQYLDRDTFITAYKNKIGKNPVSKNDFLQLLNKDSNWVTFFVKSIIQDSAKKGYEKVLFPSGNTASKVEGHTTLEEFKKEKEDRIKELEENNHFNKPVTDANQVPRISFKFTSQRNRKVQVDYLKNENGNYNFIATYLDTNETKPVTATNVLLDAYNRHLSEQKEKNNNEINQLKQELERVEGPEGFGALKPIYNFYENVVTNVLNKQFGKNSVKQVTDENGNTWNEVEIIPLRDRATILYQKETAIQAKARILKKVNANKEGFINPMKYGEALQLVGDFNKVNGAGTLSFKKAANGSYYIVPAGTSLAQQNTTQETKAPVKELEDKLRVWAKNNDIAIEAVEDLMVRFEGRYENNILGVVDFMNQLIGLADGRNIDTLPEEVAHFAIRILKDRGDISVLRAIQNIHLTSEYGEVLEEYKDVYTTDEEFREEALGKVLAKEIVNQFQNSETANNASKGIAAYVNAIKTKFINWVKGIFSKNAKARIDLQNTINPIATSILNNERIEKTNARIAQQKQEAEILYQLSEEAEQAEPEEEIEEIDEAKKNKLLTQKETFLKEARDQLIERMAMLKKGAKSQDTISKIEYEIKLLDAKITMGEYDIAINSFVKLAQEELASIYNILDKAVKNQKANTGVVSMSQNFVDMYSNLFRTFLVNIHEWGIPREERNELISAIHNATNLIPLILPKVNALAKIEGVRVLVEANTDQFGNKIDPNFDEEKAFDDTKEDMSAYRLQVGNFKYSDSKLIQSATRIIFDSIARVKRFTVGTANDLLAAQEAMLKAGGKIEDLIEYDADDKPTNYLAREYYWNRYYQKLAETKKEIAEKLQFDNYADINSAYLSKEDRKIYSEMWSSFFKDNSVEKTVTEEDASGKVSSFKIKVPNESYKNTDFKKITSNPATKAYYDLLVAKKTEAVKKLPIHYRKESTVYMLPSILKSTVDRLSSKQEGFMSKIGNLVRDSMFLDPDDTQFGQVSVLNNKMVPIFFIKPLKSSKDLSYDLARTFTLFSEMAENYQEMNKISGDLGVINIAMAQKNYIKGNVRKKGSEGANEYKALETLMDTHVFGIQSKSALATKPIPENKWTKATGIAGKQFSWAKASKLFSNFIKDNNLAFGITTAISGFLKGSGDAIIDDHVGLYTTHDSKNWARMEFMSNIPQVVSEAGRARQTNKMHLIFQENQIASLEKMLYNTTSNRASRMLLNKDILYSTYATGDYGLKGRTTLAMYDNHRLYKGKFITRAKFYEITAKEGNVANDSKHQKSVKEQWKGMRKDSLYNAYEVVNGKLQIKPEFEQYVTDGVLNSVNGKVDHLTHLIDGTLSATDKGALSRTIFGDYLLMHRGWFIGMIDTRFTREKINRITEEEEIGTYRATGSFLWNDVAGALLVDKTGLQGAMASWKNLSPARKRGVQKTALDLLYLNIVSVLAAMANIAADGSDDEDWTMQYTAYQLNRLLLEQGAAWSPAELVQMIDEPVVGARMIKDLLDMGEAFNVTEVYEGGMYEGDSHAAKWWFKKLPIRNLYEMQYPEMKNKFIKEMVDSKVYELMSPRQKANVGLLGTLKNWAIPHGLSSDGYDPIPAAVDELSQDEETDNGFN